jgi:CRISPR-associated endonuclease/helicase Cas3
MTMADVERTYRTKTGKVLTDADIEAMADEAEGGHDVATLKQRRRGRPLLGSGPAEVVPVRLDPDLRQAAEARAQAEDTTTSEIIRRALRRYVDFA